MELMPLWKSIFWVVAISCVASLLGASIGCLVSDARKLIATGTMHITAERGSVAAGVLLAAAISWRLVDYYFVRLAAPMLACFYVGQLGRYYERQRSRVSQESESVADMPEGHSTGRPRGGAPQATAEKVKQLEHRIVSN